MPSYTCTLLLCNDAVLTSLSVPHVQYMYSITKIIPLHMCMHMTIFMYMYIAQTTCIYKV